MPPIGQGAIPSGSVPPGVSYGGSSAALPDMKTGVPMIPPGMPPVMPSNGNYQVI